MRTFYIFKINNMFQTFYNDKSNVLFKMLEEVYNSNENNKINNFRLFEKVTIPFNEKILNKYFLLKHKEDYYYTNKDNNHIINSVYEVTNMKINTSHIKIKTNKNICSFMDDLFETKEKVFVVDFENKDYFWLCERNNILLV